MADIPKLVSSLGRAEHDKIYVRNYDLNKDLLGKISFAQMVCLMLQGRLPTAEEGKMIDTMLIVLVDHGMTTGAAAARMTFHSAPEAIQGAVAAAILGAGSVHLGSSEYCAKMLRDALAKEAKDADLDAVTLKTVERRLANNQLIPGIGHGIHTGGDPRAQRLFEVAEETKVYGRNCELLKKIGKIADQKVGKHLPVNVTGAIAAISLDMGFHWQTTKSFAILGRALGGLAHVGEEIRRPIARGLSNMIRDNLQYEPE
jgi:citrate synthase